MSLQDQSCHHISSLCVLKAASMVQHMKRVNGNVYFIPSERRIHEELVCAFCVNVVKISYGESKNEEGGIMCIHRHVIEHEHCLFVRKNEPHELFCAKCGDYCYSHFYDLLLNRKRTANFNVYYPSPYKNLYEIPCGEFIHVFYIIVFFFNVTH